ncbi:hypothetical protein LWI29_016526 [Acer saccharum]|uniref:Neprosin PEP catalytic domain-containing protein n=1 Tax=Acer saccharum TaxID=4024 RepID=A0AA39W1B1_ACESA|nr:hypothetical protein LWI29_016526 [Acer saccharum]
MDNFGENKYSSFEVQSKGCPKGMVPILRTKVDVTDLNVISRIRLENIHPLSATQPGKNVYPLIYGDNLTRFTGYWTDQVTGNWWLFLDDKQIGYWPKELFTHLKGGADSIHYGGWTYHPPENIMSPPMGIGLLPDRIITKYSSFFYNMQVAYQYNNFIDINGRNLERIVDNTSCYNAIYLGTKLDAVIRGDTFNYGGPGGKCSGI